MPPLPPEMPLLDRHRTALGDEVRYRRSVEALAAARSDFVFPAHGRTHAATVVETMLRHAEHRVDVFAGNLCSEEVERYPVLIKAIGNAIVFNRVPVRILVEEKAPEDAGSIFEETLARLNATYPHLAQVRSMSPKFHDPLQQIGQQLELSSKFYFVVADATAYHVRFPAGDRKSFCSLNGPDIAAPLAALFNEHFGEGEPYFPTR